MAAGAREGCGSAKMSAASPCPAKTWIPRSHLGDERCQRMLRLESASSRKSTYPPRSKAMRWVQKEVHSCHKCDNFRKNHRRCLRWSHDEERKLTHMCMRRPESSRTVCRIQEARSCESAEPAKKDVAGLGMMLMDCPWLVGKNRCCTVSCWQRRFLQE